MNELLENLKKVGKVLIDLNDGYMTNWVMELVSVHKIIKDYSLEDKLKAYHDKYINDIGLHFFKEEDIEDDAAQEFWDFVDRIAQQSLDILS